MACNDRQLSDAQREAGFDQQRTGVGQAIRPFSGSPTVENLIDYCNRELVPVLRATRNAANDVWRQVVDNAPSANPLAFYFSTTTAAADPTAGRVRLNQAVQNTATVIRVSESNGRLQSVQPWLDVMSGGPTSPLGTVTLLDAINPGRFLRFDLNTMTDQGAYWDLGVTFIEGSDASPFVDDEAVTIGFIAGVSAAGSTVPVTALSPIANDTFVGNVSGASAAPAAVNLSTLAGAGLNFAAHTLDVTGSTSITITSDQVQRAALTGAITAPLNSNATAFGTAAAKSVLANATNATAVPAFLAGTAAFQYLRVNTSNNALEWSVINNIGWDDVLSVDAHSGAFSPIIDSGQHLIFAAAGALNGAITSNANLVIDSDVQIFNSSPSFCWSISSGTENFRFRGASGGCGIQLQRCTAPVSAPEANTALFWFKTEGNAERAMCRTLNSTGVTLTDWPLDSTGLGTETATTAVTNSTTVIDITDPFTIPANSLVVGSRWRVTATFKFARGATVTALNLNASIDLGGSSLSLTAAAANVTASFAGVVRIEGEFTVDSTGAGGTGRAVLTSYTDCDNTATNGKVVTASNLAFGINTTSALSFRGRAQMSAAVANCTITAIGGNVERVS